jgi:hypothetical protein
MNQQKVKEKTGSMEGLNRFFVLVEGRRNGGMGRKTDRTLTGAQADYGSGLKEEAGKERPNMSGRADKTLTRTEAECEGNVAEKEGGFVGQAHALIKIVFII